MPIPSTHQLPASRLLVLMTIHTLEMFSEFSSTGKEAGGVCVTQSKAYNHFRSFNHVCILNNVQ